MARCTKCDQVLPLPLCARCDEETEDDHSYLSKRPLCIGCYEYLSDIISDLLEKECG